MENDRRRSCARHPRWAAVGIVLAALAPTPAAQAARGIIDANQHPVLPADGCNHVPAFPTLGASSDVSLQVYHVSKNLAELPQARCYNHYSKPRIFSDDATFSNLACNSRQLDYIDTICADINDNDPLAGTARGVEHYEHWEGELTDRAKNGETIGGFNTWPDGGCAQAMMADFATHVRDSGCAGMKPYLQPVVPLSPNGTLTRATGSNPRRLLWNGNPATLIGFGHMGALAAGSRTILVGSGPNDGYLGTLRHYGANLTRIWAIEQWAGLATCHTPQLEGLTPFSGTWAGGYDLSVEGLNPSFFKRLREFAQLAADRGIVVQLDLFDKHGLQNFSCRPKWDGSPYNMLHNTTPEGNRFIDGSGLDTFCSCGPCGADALDSPNEQHCNTINAVLRDNRIKPIHKAYLERVAKEVGGVGNMIFEIMNEMKANQDWVDIGEDWQINDVAKRLNLELPVFVARDAFNDESGELISLGGKSPDAGNGSTWIGNNAKVQRTLDAETGIQMGKAVSNSAATTWRGSIALANLSPKTAVSVRGVIRPGATAMTVGLSEDTSPTQRVIRVVASSPPVLVPYRPLDFVLESKYDAFTTTYAIVGAGASGYAETDVRLQVNYQYTPPTADLFLNSVPVLQGIPLTAPNLPEVSYAYFLGSKGSNFILGESSIDNFEADVYCSVEGAPYNCAP